MYFCKDLHDRFIVPFRLFYSRIVEQFLKDQVDDPLAYFDADALESVPHLLWVFQIYDIEGDLVADNFRDNSLGYSYLYTVFFDLFVHRAGFCRLGRGPVETRSHTSFFITMDFVIIDHIGQFAKPVSFSRLALFLRCWSLIPLPWLR